MIQMKRIFILGLRKRDHKTIQYHFAIYAYTENYFRESTPKYSLPSLFVLRSLGVTFKIQYLMVKEIDLFLYVRPCGLQFMMGVKYVDFERHTETRFAAVLHQSLEKLHILQTFAIPEKPLTNAKKKYLFRAAFTVLVSLFRNSFHSMIFFCRPTKTQTLRFAEGILGKKS